MSSAEPERYRVDFTPNARKSLQALPRKVQERIAPKIDALADNPRPHGVEKLTGEDDQYRIRVGNYRVVYTINDGRLVVTVVRIADRRDVYRRRGN